MKRRFRHCVLASLVLLCASAFAQTAPTWNSLGPAGGGVSALLTSPASSSTLFAGTPENGVFISTDAGQTWTAANAGLVASTAGRQTLLTVYTLIADGQYVYAATAAGLFYRNASTGTSWTALTATGSTTPITFLAFDSATKRLFAATDAMTMAPGVYSTNLDTTMSAPSPTWSFHALPMPAGLVQVSSVAVVAQAMGAAPAGLLVSMGNSLSAAPILVGDQTLTWSNADPTGTLSGSSVNALAYSAELLQAYACSGGTAYYAGNPLDALPVWTLASVPMGAGVSFNCTGFASVPTSMGGVPQVALGTDQGAFASIDGINFLATGSMGASKSANAFAVAAPSGPSSASVFVGSGFGVSSVAVPAFVGNANWAASNGPASVTPGGSNSRLNNANVVDSAMIGTRLFAAAVSTQYVEVFSSADGGATWSATNIAAALNPFEEIVSLAPDATRGILYAGATQGLLAYSTASSQWSAVTAFTAGRVTALATGATAAFAGTDNGMFAVPMSATPASAMPVAAGLTGKGVKSILVAGGNVYAAVIDASGSSVVYVASETSVAAGTPTWSQFGTNILGAELRVTGLVLVGSTLLAATSGNLVMFASQGTAWASANTSASAAQRISDTFGVVNGLYSDGTSIYAATGSNGIFVTPVAGFTWTQLNGSGGTALPSIEVHTLRASGSTLYAATRAGIAAYAGLTPVVVPPATPPPASSSSGGGIVDLRFGVLLLAAVIALRRVRTAG